MAGSVNKVILVGTLGRDPEVKTFNNGVKLVNLSIATSETWRDKNSGERKERTEWHKVTISNEGLAKVAEQYLKKGSRVYLEGQLETRKWQAQDGTDRYSTEIVLRPYHGELVILTWADNGDDGGSRGGGQSRGNGGGGYSGGQAKGQGGGSRGPAYDDPDDQIPF